MQTKLTGRPRLDLLKTDPETSLEVNTDGKRLIIAPVEKPTRRQKFDAAQELTRTHATAKLSRNWRSKRAPLDELIEIHTQQFEQYGRATGPN